MKDRLEQLEAEIEILKRENAALRTELGVALASVSAICLKIPTIAFSMHSNDVDLTSQRIDEFLRLVKRFDARVDEFFLSTASDKGGVDE